MSAAETLTLTASVSRTSRKRKQGELGATNENASSHDDDSESPSKAPIDHDALLPEQPENVVQAGSVEVVSHAVARKRRKHDAKAGDVSSEKNKSSGRRGEEKPAKRQNSVWVGNLSFQTTQRALKQFFRLAGEVTRIHMPMKSEAMNRGFAYVDFATADGKTEAIACSERDLDGRKLLIKDGDDFNGRPTTAENAATIAGPSTGYSRFAQKVLKRQKQAPAPTLFMGNLGFEVTADSIRAMIEAHERVRNDKARARMKGAKLVAKKLTTSSGDGSSSEEEEEPSEEQYKSSLVKVRVGTFEDSGNCKGFAFLDFHDTQLATATLIDPRNYSMDRREVKLEYAGADAVRRGGLHPRAVEGVERASKPDARGRESVKKSVPSGDAVARDQAGEKGAARLPKQGGAPGEKVTNGGGNHHRAPPGATLASAPRQQASIVPSQGKKITF